MEFACILGLEIDLQPRLAVSSALGGVTRSSELQTEV